MREPAFAPLLALLQVNIMSFCIMYHASFFTQRTGLVLLCERKKLANFNSIIKVTSRVCYRPESYFVNVTSL